MLGGVERGQKSQHKENHALNLLWGQEQHGIYPWLKFGPSRLCCASVSARCEGGAWVPAGACGACKGQAVLLTKARVGGNSGNFPV